MENLQYFLDQHSNDYICIHYYMWNDCRTKSGSDWIAYFGDDSSLYNVTYQSNDGGDSYDYYICIE